MDRHVRSPASRHGGVNVRTFHNAPLGNDAAGLSHDHDGFIDVNWLRDNTPFQEADFYLCGPKLVTGLMRRGGE